MKSIPPDIAARWSPMWAGPAETRCADRPWWHKDYSQHPTFSVYTYPSWVRCDGRRGSLCDKFSVPDGHEADVNGDRLAALDAEQPLLPPPPMPGQVWAWPSPGRGNVESALVTEVRDGSVIMRAGWRYNFPEEWPPEDAVLVAGPTPWGRDVPWSAP